MRKGSNANLAFKNRVWSLFMCCPYLALLLWLIEWISLKSPTTCRLPTLTRVPTFGTNHFVMLDHVLSFVPKQVKYLIFTVAFVFSRLTPSHPGTGEGDASHRPYLLENPGQPADGRPGPETGSINHARRVRNKKSHCHCKPESSAEGLSTLLIREQWPQVILQGSKSIISIPSVLC